MVPAAVRGQTYFSAQFVSPLSGVRSSGLRSVLESENKVLSPKEMWGSLKSSCVMWLFCFLVALALDTMLAT